MKLVLLIPFFITACGFVPIRNCLPKLYEMENKPCLLRKLDDGSTDRICPEDERYPKDAISITVTDYNCERSYQDLLIVKCKNFSK
ncbi:MAG: hypothetical protein IID03_12445 [Candidatus Dadabacteria bacterium]|nr:hypothetical protein [Candidatus Dadabacteria bacterium]